MTDKQILQFFKKKIFKKNFQKKIQKKNFETAETAETALPLKLLKLLYALCGAYCEIFLIQNGSK